jgi:hypothetical protein
MIKLGIIYIKVEYMLLTIGRDNDHHFHLFFSLAQVTGVTRSMAAGGPGEEVWLSRATYEWRVCLVTLPNALT